MEKIKRLFSTPKRRAITITVMVVAFMVFSAGAVVAAVVWEMNEDRVEYAIEEKLRPDPGPAPAQPADQAQAPDQAQTQSPDQAQPADQAQAPAAADGKKITQEKAESIALSDAGFKKSQVSHLYSHYEWDDGYQQYDVRFFNGDYEYEYAIDAVSGAILEQDMDHIYD